MNDWQIHEQIQEKTKKQRYILEVLGNYLTYSDQLSIPFLRVQLNTLSDLAVHIQALTELEDENDVSQPD